MKILFIGDYSNLHASLGAELKRKGHEVTVLSDGGSYMATHSDIFLERTPGIAGGFKYLFRLFSLLPELKGYDAVQLVNTNFLKLRPGKIKYFFDRLKSQNGAMFLTLAGNDYYFVKACNDARMFRFSEFKIGDKPTEFVEESPSRLYGWLTESNRRLAEYVYEHIDGAMSVLPEYDMASRPFLGERLNFTNLPVDTGCLKYEPVDFDGKLRIFIGMKEGMEIQKGTKKLLSLAREIEREMPDKVEVESVRNLPLNEYLDRMRRSHIVLDQLYSYSPGLNGLQAMALGKVAGTGAQPEYYEYIGNPEHKPVFALSPLRHDLKEAIIKYAENPERLITKGEEGRKLVERCNEASMVADRFINHWEKFCR